MHIFKEKIKLNNKGIIIIFICFIISSNIAWLNPAPGKESYQPYAKIPLFWQYNYDSGIEILTAAYFPKIFYKDNTRIDRPTYPVLANLIGKFTCLAVCPFFKLSELEKAGIGYIILKIFIFLLALFLLNEMQVIYLNNKEIILSNFLIFFSIISIGNIAVFHTIELQFITPIIALYLFFNLIKNYNIFKNFLFSLIIGILILAKPNYAIYLSILTFSLIYKKYFEVILSIVFHLIPLVLYIIYLKYLSLDFIFIGAKSGQGIWFMQMLYNLEISNFLIKIIYSVYIFSLLLIDNFKIWLIFCIIGLYIFRKNINKKILLFCFIFLFFTWLQIFISFRHKTYMTSDLMVIIYPFASVGFFYMISLIKLSYIKKYLIITAVILTSINNISAYTNFPLIHPYNQPAKNPQKMSGKLDNLVN